MASDTELVTDVAAVAAAGTVAAEAGTGFAGDAVVVGRDGGYGNGDDTARFALEGDGSL